MEYIGIKEKNFTIKRQKKKKNFIDRERPRRVTRMAPSSSSGLTFKLHPLVIVNISDHHTRVKTQLNPPASVCASGNVSDNGEAMFQQDPRVYGCVIGVQKGHKKVFPDFYILGWYSTGNDAEESDMHIHKALMDINESPVYVLLNPAINHAQKDLPVTIYESELHVIDGIPQLIFVHTTYTIETVEAERISVDHVAHLKPSDGGSAATQCEPYVSHTYLAAHLTGIHTAIKMLNSRIRVLYQYLAAMQKGYMTRGVGSYFLGDIPCDNSLLRQVSSLLRRLPAMASERFQDDFLMEYNDKLLITYLAMVTNCSSTMNEMIDKFNAAYERNARRGGRTAFIYLKGKITNYMLGYTTSPA
ncbi:unnamed protein product [Thlaspi arvense]|uniref:COP9 signalosome complex subunit 6 n=1 Tax=Thlaspi arvense TaxID=13288 RepID=A0AAU9SQ84_THLAR|nr:unnamed protein product [Thlaspi arvense]